MVDGDFEIMADLLLFEGIFLAMVKISADFLWTAIGIMGAYWQ
jgi:hypothetical protein